MNFGELRRKILLNLPKRDAYDHIFVGSWINEAIKYICSIKNWWFLKNRTTINISADVKSYDLPDNLKQIVALLLTKEDGYDILESSSLLDAVKYYGNRKGIPERYVVNFVDNKIDFYPTPNEDRVVLMFYYGFLPELSGAHDTNYLLEKYPHIVEAATLKIALEANNEFETAKYYSEKLNSYLVDLNAVDNSLRLPQEMTIIPRADVKASSFDETTIRALLDYW